MEPKLKDYLFSFLSIFVNVCSNLVMVPIYVKYFGSVDYGVWIVVNTLLQYLMLGNFGLPTALTTIATNSLHQEPVMGIFKKSLRLMLVIAGCLGMFVIVLFVTNLIPYEFFFGESARTQFYGTVLFLTITLYLLRAPFQLAASVFLILGKITLNKKYEILSNIIVPISFLFTYLFDGNISFYAITWGSLLFFSSLTMFFHAISCLKTYQKDEKELNPSTIKYAEIFKTGMGYFVISIGALLVWNTDNFVIVNFLGIQHITSYSLTFRIFTAFFSILITLNAILLPFYGRYNSEKSYHSINLKFRSSVSLMALIAGPLCIFIFLFSREIFLLWTNNPSLYLGRNIFLAFGFYTYVLSCLNSISTLLSALKRVRLLIIATFLEGISNLILSIIFIKKFGVYGVSLGTLSASLISLTFVCLFFNRHVKIPVEVPITIILKNLAALVIVSAILLSTSLMAENMYMKLIIFIIFIVSYALLNLIDIASLIKSKSNKYA